MIERTMKGTQISVAHSMIFIIGAPKTCQYLPFRQENEVRPLSFAIDPDYRSAKNFPKRKANQYR